MGFLSSIKKAASKVTSTVKSAASGITSAVSNAKSGITSAVSGLKSGITSAVSGVKNFVSEGYLSSAISGAVTGFATGGFAGAAVGAAAGIAAKKLASGQKAEENIELSTTDDSVGYNLGTVDGANAYFKDNNYGLTVNDAGVVYSDTTGEVVGQYNFTTYTIEPPTAETEAAGLSNIPANVAKKTSATTSASSSWKSSYKAITKAYWTPGTSTVASSSVNDNAK